MSLIVSSARRNSNVLFEEESGQPTMWTQSWINYPFYCCKMSHRSKVSSEKMKVIYENNEVKTKDGKVITVHTDVEYTVSSLKEKYILTRNKITNMRRKTMQANDAATILEDVIVSSIADLIPTMDYPEISKLKPEFSEKIFSQVIEKLKTSHVTVKSIDVVEVCDVSDGMDESADLATASKDVDDTEEDDGKYLLDIEHSNKNESGEVETSHDSDEYDIIQDLAEKEDKQGVKEITEEINESTQTITEGDEEQQDEEQQDEEIQESQYSEKPADSTDDDYHVISDSEAEVGAITIANSA